MATLFDALLTATRLTLGHRVSAGLGYWYGQSATNSTDPTTLPELMRVTSAGRVGIGAPDPQKDLHVAGSARLDGDSEVRPFGGGGVVVDLAEHSFGYGLVRVTGPNGFLNAAVFGNGSAHPDRGKIAVHNEFGTERAWMTVNSAGRGEISGDIKNFKMPNPDEPGTDIWYASVEGPEAAAYIRGTATLVNGHAVIVLPAHFRAVGIQAGMTVQLTPRSADSLGLASVERTLARIVVKELHHGVGNYEFDWEVKSVRKGFENYQVVRPSNDVAASRGQ